MSFNVEARPHFTETVKVTSPGGEESTFIATFLALDVPAFQEYDLDTGEGTTAFLETALQHADDLVDKRGDPVAFTPEIKAGLIAKGWVRVPLTRAYLEGLNKAIRGN